MGIGSSSICTHCLQGLIHCFRPGVSCLFVPSPSQKLLSQKLCSHAPAAPSPMPAYTTGSASAALFHPGPHHAAAMPLHCLLPPASTSQGGGCDPRAGRGCCHPWGSNPEETLGGFGCTERPPFHSILVELKFSKKLLT